MCLSSQPTQQLNLFDILIDTDDCIGGEKVTPGPGAPMLCVLSGTSVSIGGLVRGEGSLPLAVLASGSLIVTQGSTLDVSSSRANGPGAGANAPGCTRVDGANNAMGGGGGAGGSFGTTAAMAVTARRAAATRQPRPRRRSCAADAAAATVATAWAPAVRVARVAARCTCSRAAR